MKKFLLFSFLAVFATCAFAQKKPSQHVRKANNWIYKHSNPPKKGRKNYPGKHHKDKSVHHAAMHTEHWISDHLKPRKKK